jgi:hypothetical protein
MKLKTKRKISRILQNCDELSKMEFVLLYNELWGIESKPNKQRKEGKNE